MNKKQRADKIIEVSKWMSKQGYDRKFTQGVSNVIVDYLDSHFSKVSGQLPLRTRVKLNKEYGKDADMICTIFEIVDYGGQDAYRFQEISGMYLAGDFTVIDA